MASIPEYPPVRGLAEEVVEVEKSGGSGCDGRSIFAAGDVIRWPGIAVELPYCLRSGVLELLISIVIVYLDSVTSDEVYKMLALPSSTNLGRGFLDLDLLARTPVNASPD